MNSVEIKFLGLLWQRLVGGQFDRDVFLRKIRETGGHEILCFSRDQLLALLEGRFLGDYEEVFFVFAEIMPCYVSFENEPEKIVFWAFAVLMIADAAIVTKREVSMQFDSFMDAFIRFRSRLTTDESIFILARFLNSEHGCGPPADIGGFELEALGVEMKKLAAAGDFIGLSQLAGISDAEREWLLDIGRAVKAGDYVAVRQLVREDRWIAGPRSGEAKG